MSQPAPELRILTRADLEADQIYDTWDDPHQLARPSPEKRRTLLGNPCLRADDPVQIIGLLANRVVGKMEVLVGEISVLGRVERIFYGSSLWVEEAARQTGIGLMILLKIQALHHTVGVCGISQMIYPIYQKLRWTDFQIPRLVFVRRSRAVVESMLCSRLLARPASWAIDACLSGLRSWLGIELRRRLKNVRVEVAAEFPADWDAFVARKPSEVGPVRSAAWINWLLQNRFQDAPGLQRRLLLVRSDSGEPLGYLLMKSRFYDTVTQRQLRNITLASAQDWQVFDTRRLSTSTLMLLAVKSMADVGADALEVAMPDPDVAAELSRAGFRRVGVLNFMLRTGAMSPVREQAFHELARWVIRPADGDNFFS
jgi:hypothetical protein